MGLRDAAEGKQPGERQYTRHLQNPGGHLLYERGPLKVLDGLFAELCLDVVGAEPLDHVDVAGRVPKGLRGNGEKVKSELFKYDDDGSHWRIWGENNVDP